MIGAGKARPVALLIGAELVAAMRAFVEQEADFAITVTHHQNRHRPDGFGDIIVFVGDLAGMADIDPGAIPDLFQLILENRLVVIKAAMHAGWFNECFIINGRGELRHHGTTGSGLSIIVRTIVLYIACPSKPVKLSVSEASRCFGGDLMRLFPNL